MRINNVQPILSDDPIDVSASKINVEFIKRRFPLFPNRLLFRRTESNNGKCVSFYFDIPECEEQLRNLLEIEDYSAAEVLQLFLDEITYSRIGMILHCFDGISFSNLKQLLIHCMAYCVA